MRWPASVFHQEAALHFVGGVEYKQGVTMSRAFRLFWFWAALSSTLSLGACGGGGAGDSQGSNFVPPPTTRVHQPATMQVTAANGQHVSAHAYSIVTALNQFAAHPCVDGYVSPTTRTVSITCLGQDLTISYDDADKDGRPSVGDSILADAGPAALLRGGSVRHTLLRLENGEAAEIQVDFNSWSLGVYSDGFPAQVTGRAIWRDRGASEVFESVSELVAEIKTYAPFPLGTKLLAKLTLNNFVVENFGPSRSSVTPLIPNFDMEVSMDMTISSPVVPEGRFQVASDGKIAWYPGIHRVAPSPNKFLVKGTNGSVASLLGTPAPDFRVNLTIDPVGSGQPLVNSLMTMEDFYKAH